MRALGAIYLRELRAYFFSPIAFVLLVGFVLITGWWFSLFIADYQQTSMMHMRNPLQIQLSLHYMVVARVIQSSTTLLIFITPLLTMRLLSEEKKSGTIEVLLSYPLSDSQVVLGKFLAAWSVLALMVLTTWLNIALLASFTPVTWPAALIGYLGLLLFGGAYLAMGLLASSLTENQIISALVAFGGLLALFMLDRADAIAGPEYGAWVKSLAMWPHFINFLLGVIDTADITYFLLFMALFLFATIRVLEAKRWKG